MKRIKLNKRPIVALVMVSVVLAAFGVKQYSDGFYKPDLVILRTAVNHYYANHHSLPVSLRDLGPLQLRQNLEDYTYTAGTPLTGGEYRYKLCSGDRCYEIDAYQANLTESKYGSEYAEQVPL